MSTAPRPWHASAENIALPVLALAGALLLFGLFVWLGGRSPVEAWTLLFKGAFGDAFSWQNSLQRAAPLMLTALAVALPARAGLVVIGGEGALVVGALACAAVPYVFAPPANAFGSAMLMLAAAIGGGLWVALAGALRQWRGVNETISSLLLGYIAIALFKHIVEGPLRDPASLNKPSTKPLAEGLRIGPIMGANGFDSWLGDVHWGLVIGLVLCLLAGLWLSFTAHGMALRVVGGNAKAARLVGLPSTRLILVACAAGGGCAGLAGGIEVAAVQTSANASVIAGLGYTGILVAFVARQNPWAIPPVALLFGGFGAAGSLLQRRMDLPDASVLVLQGFAFVLILASEALRGKLFQRPQLPRLRKVPKPPVAAPTTTSTVVPLPTRAADEGPAPLVSAGGKA
ncbi:MAG TPA: ABC transporter permease [Ideonella sp.]|uniref:ABC transporter permease n=1 Tax=Ideonella sp. TaxID=1929293 RepID=UPI002C5FDAC8|nr:ABC transporter permease [Ideonella sp.]HSI47016.1 ABC transporter permease [Ideonella sp.]